jgi:hypothetical protein
MKNIFYIILATVGVMVVFFSGLFDDEQTANFSATVPHGLGLAPIVVIIIVAVFFGFARCGARPSRHIRRRRVEYNQSCVVLNEGRHHSGV